MTRILLIRHGSTDLLHDRLCGRAPSISLNERGRCESRSLADGLALEYQVDAIYSSPLERALETADILSSRCGAPVSKHEGLNEVDFGCWTGRLFSDLESMPEWHAYNRMRSLYGPPGGESLLIVQNRVWGAVHSISAGHRDATIALVGHGDPIRALLLLFLGMPLDHILRIEIAPASISEVSLGSSCPIVQGVNRIFRQRN
ncbi:MAG: histidine phosphatase family protein [Acidobacteriaceae bacterium]|nr:histidine phosphatase family protein [Acidobacteriaceae bacterium]